MGGEDEIGKELMHDQFTMAHGDVHGGANELSHGIEAVIVAIHKSIYDVRCMLSIHAQYTSILFVHAMWFCIHTSTVSTSAP